MLQSATSHSDRLIAIGLVLETLGKQPNSPGLCEAGPLFPLQGSCSITWAN